MELKFRTLTKDDVEVRVGATKKDNAGGITGVSLLLYKNARVDMSILDESVGVTNWQRKHISLKDNIYCSVGIRVDNGEWVWKEDCGVCANDSDEVIRDKGEASDAFKRACFNWGIGRELYTAPFIWVSTNTKYGNYEVSDMVVSDDHKITKLVIINAKTKAVVFSFGGTQPQPQPQPQPQDKQGQTRTTTGQPQQPADALIKLACDEFDKATNAEECVAIWKRYTWLQNNHDFVTAKNEAKIRLSI